MANPSETGTEPDAVDYPTIACPACGDVVTDFDGFGFVACTVCGHCTHPSRDAGICGICGDDDAKGFSNG